MPAVTAALKVELVLRERILDGSLQPGSRLDQRGIARELGVSRLPVRDALMTLAAEGLVFTTPHRGTIVGEVDHEGLVELFELRIALEPGAAARAVPNLDGAVIEQLTVLVEMMESITDPAEWRARHDEFHSLLVARSGRRRTIEIIESARSRCGAAWSFDRACIAAARTDHRLILRAATGGDVVGVRLLMEAHLALGYGRSVELSGVLTAPRVGLHPSDPGGIR
ncbi:MAG: GntR family transcriptional regulator [Acidimicrobiia bacterium]